jgi:hypothetical protein
MCQPIHKYWQPQVPGHCANASQYIFGVIGVTIATDVLVALIPAWLLHDLRMSLKNKIEVIVFLSLPLAVTAIGCYRLHQFIIFFSFPNPALENPHNVRNALTSVEANLGVIAACGPTIKWILVSYDLYFCTRLSLISRIIESLYSLFQYRLFNECLYTKTIISPTTSRAWLCQKSRGHRAPAHHVRRHMLAQCQELMLES